MTPPMAAARIQRWALILSAYDYAIQYKERIQNANADALSRLQLPDTPGSTQVPEETILLMELLETTPIRAEQVKNWTKRTPILARALKCIKQGWPSKCPDGEFQPYFQRQDELRFKTTVYFGETEWLFRPKEEGKWLPNYMKPTQEYLR
jgi:hypothetical protein